MVRVRAFVGKTLVRIYTLLFKHYACAFNNCIAATN